MKSLPVIVALDLDKISEVEKLIRRLGTAVDFYKVGLKLYTRYGPDLLKVLKRHRKKIFLDLKFHDIPNTVAEACRAAARLKVQMLTVHASGGSAMLAAARSAIQEESRRVKAPPPWLMAVTVLTSFDSLGEIGISRGILPQVLKLAELAVSQRCDGVICSPQEIQKLRARVPANFKIVTPGVRPAGSSLGDQKRVLTPEEALRRGADAVVMGRPILEAKDPGALLRNLNIEKH